MKTLVISGITLYQVVFATILKQLFGIQAFCRYRPTCSAYTKQMIQRFGIIKGGYLGMKRILSCNPFTSYGNI